ncbi:helix-turn-helix domain-containing protein [Pseudomonas putida]|uniref:helix-turn-helix domain-containing protein n=1 Tax=Pseudomonas putida TaxID=303 RepID=UPI00370CF54C
MNIGDRLKEERKRLGLNQTEFAALLGASKTSQFNYEKGDRSPDAAYLAAAAQSGVDVLYVVTGERTPRGSESISASEALMLQNYRALSAKDQDAVIRLTAGLLLMNSVTR